MLVEKLVTRLRGVERVRGRLNRARTGRAFDPIEVSDDLAFLVEAEQTKPHKVQAAVCLTSFGCWKSPCTTSNATGFFPQFGRGDRP